MNTITGYMYVRSHPSWDKFECYKIGITENIINREGTYKTSEIERGDLIKIFKFDNITKIYLNEIDKVIKESLQSLNFIKNAGTEFYKYNCIYLLEDIFIKNNINFIELTDCEITELKRKIYNDANNLLNIAIIDTKINPYPYQLETLDKMKTYYKINNIGKILWSCGLGKALLGIFFVKQSNYKNIIIGIPSIHLQKQMKNEILKIFNNKASILTIGGDKQKENKDIDNFINYNTNNYKFIITTYSSCHMLSNKNYYFVSYKFYVLLTILSIISFRTLGLSPLIFIPVIYITVIRNSKFY